MGYLVTEIIGLLLGAAVLGLVIGWALFGLGKKKVITTVDNPALEGELKAERDLRKKADTRILELESKDASISAHVKEREAKVADLSKQLDELTRQRAQSASETESKQQRIAALETELAQRQEEIKRLATDRRSGDLDERLVERDRLIARYKADLENALAVAGRDTGKVSQLEKENAELRAALAAPVSAAPPAPTKELAEKDATIARLTNELKAALAVPAPEMPVKELAEKDATIARLHAELKSALAAPAPAAPGKELAEKDSVITRLNAELTDLRTSLEASEQALEEQDAAIDKLTRDLQGVQHRLAVAEGRETASMTRPRVPRPVTNPRFQAVGEGSDTTVSMTLDSLVAQADQTAQRRPATTGSSPRPMTTGTSPRPTTTEASPRPPVMTDTNPRPMPNPTTGTARRPTGTTGVFPRVGGAQTGSAARPITSDPQASESTLAISLESLVAQIDSKPVTPGPITRSTPRVTESTGMTALADMVAAIDAARPSLPQAPEGMSDDLMRIDGVSSTSATRLNALGLRTWKQLASLNDAQLAQVADILRVSVDKIKREQWVEQARALAK